MIQSNIKQIMEKKRITLKRMVEDTGLAEMTIIRARRGQIASCQLETLLVMADYLNCTVEELYTRTADVIEEDTPGKGDGQITV